MKRAFLNARKYIFSMIINVKVNDMAIYNPGAFGHCFDVVFLSFQV